MIKKINFFKNKYLFTFLALALLLVLSFLYFYYQNKKNGLIYPLEKPEDLKPLIKKAAEASFVLLGESSHGTAEYYKWRALISKDLIAGHGFSLIVVEGDWDALYQINSYIRHELSPLGGAREIMKKFDRWPTWMWANEEFLDFVEWLRSYNSHQLRDQMVSLYGKDIYGGVNSINLVLDYLSSQSDDFKGQALEAYSCLSDYNYDWQEYVYQLSLGASSCENKLKFVIELLNGLNKTIKDQDYFNALQNAWVVVHAEEHYRANLFSSDQSWNSRVFGMKNIFNNSRLKHGPNTKTIIWAHNTHIGDARATEMSNSGLINIGQLLRERYDKEKVFIVGFGTFKGTVIAGLSWDGPAQVLRVPPAKDFSLESFLASKNNKDFFIFLDSAWDKTVLAEKLGHRAKGVVYNPVNDSRQYVETVTKDRYDAFIFLHETSALSPIK